MSLPSTKAEFLELLNFDKQSIDELRSSIEQNKAEGKSNQKLYKAIIIALEKRIKHLIEYEKRFNELPNEEPQNEAQSQNEVRSQIDDKAPTIDDQITESNSVQTKPKPQSGVNKSAATKNKSKTRLKSKYRLTKKPFKNKKTEPHFANSADP